MTEKNFTSLPENLNDTFARTNKYACNAFIFYIKFANCQRAPFQSSNMLNSSYVVVNMQRLVSTGDEKIRADLDKTGSMCRKSKKNSWFRIAVEKVTHAIATYYKNFVVNIE